MIRSLAAAGMRGSIDLDQSEANAHEHRRRTFAAVARAPSTSADQPSGGGPGVHSADEVGLG
jgi:hypothetical protein